MTTPFRALPLRERAIALLKEGRSADEVHAMFVAEGAHPDEVRSVLSDLVALQHQAAARNPERLRGEAMWMFARGASVDHVVEHFARVGVGEEYARPEAERLFAVFQKMRPCQRCGTPTDPSRLVLDTNGFSICNGCNLRDEIFRSEQRGVARDLQTLGMLGGVVGVAIVSAVEAGADPVGTTRPFCARCRQPSGVSVGALPPDWRARLDPAAAWVCSLCWQRIA